MFLKLRRPAGKPARVPAEASKTAPAAGETVPGEEARVKKIENLEEMVNKRRLDLEEAKQQLNQLINTVADSEPLKDEATVEALFTQPGQAAEGLPIPKKEEVVVKEADLKALLKDEGGKKAESKSEVKVEAKPETKPESKGKDDAMAGIFEQQAEEENPLQSLINSLPDVTAMELLNEAREVSIILHELRMQKTNSGSDGK